MISSDKLHISLFRNVVNQYLEVNLTQVIRNTLSNMLALDYMARPNSMSADNWAEHCAQKLKRFLQNRVISDESFSAILSLFTVAISKEDINYQDKANVVNQEQSQDAVVGAIISNHFGDCSTEEKQQITAVLKTLLQNKTPKELLNYINAEPKIVVKVIMTVAQSLKTNLEIAARVEKELGTLIRKSQNLQDQTYIFKDLFSKITTVTCATLVVGACVAFGGAVLPLVIIPATIVANRYGSEIGEQIGSQVAKMTHAFQKDIIDITQLQNEKLNSLSQTIEKVQNANVNQSHSQELGSIKQTLSGHLGQEGDAKKPNELSSKGPSKEVGM